ncbi:N-acyl-D-amino-acid deacylase family protein [Isoptericola jiangsuensis]|uniref:N-acyl-D-amino-acid deacylase family protein n=1 Tax=Isoptericola jiangsuensis TaxID=548579 RepID=UPI003AAF7356
MTGVRGVDVVHGAVLARPDGTTTGPVDLHLGAGRVVEVLPAGSRPGHGRTLDAGGRLALPGFLDAHVHGGAAVFDEHVQHALLRQGVTGIVVGADGIGAAPSDARSAAWAAGYFAAIDGAHPGFAGGSVGDLLATYDGTTPIGVATLVPHATLRCTVMGTAQRAATPAEVEEMVRLATQAFDDGAVGLSTGLEYVPAAWAEADELVALARGAASRGLPHVSHMRGYEAAAGPAFAELLAIAAASGAATHVSHLHGPADDLVRLLDDARAAGHDVTFDSYPYLRGCSILAMVALPSWLPLADPDAALAALADPPTAARVRAHLDGLDDLWPRVTLAWAPGLDGVAGAGAGAGGADGADGVAGSRLTDVAARWGLRPADAALRILVETRLRAGCVFAQPPTNSAASVRSLANHPAHLAGSDAIYQPLAGGGRPHPRGWGTFARYLAEHVVATGDWTWHDAVQHLSARAAARFGLPDRGHLSPGAAADVVLVDPATVRDLATYDAPRTPATGIDDVLVAGTAVLADGDLTGATPGGPLRARRRPRATAGHRATAGLSTAEGLPAAEGRTATEGRR